MMNAVQHAYLEAGIMQKFGRSKEEAQRTVNELEAMIFRQDEKIIYDLQYKIFTENDPRYTRMLVQFLFQGFSYLYDTAQNKEEKQRLQEGVSKLFDFLFIDRCMYAKQMETQSVAAQHILKNVSSQLNTVLKTQERMIANLSHEMRTSLNAITGYLTILEESKAIQGEEKFHLKKALNGAASLQSLVKDILNITKLNSGQLEIKKEFFTIQEMLLECIDHLSIEIKNRPHIDFQFQSKFMPLRVYGDKMHIMEILINFLSNAFKYTKTGFITLSMDYSIETDGIQATFSVSDSGSGMTPEQVEDVFSPYSRYQKEKEGLGLGMHITKQLAEKLGGTLNVQSTFRQGTTFSFTCSFEKYRPIELHFEGKKICFYVEEAEITAHLKEKIHFMKACGAEITHFKKESALINYLLNEKEDMPDIISIMAQPEAYAKFDALIYYLRSAKQFNHTAFIAENMQQHLSLKYFDELYEYCAPLSLYKKLLRNQDALLRESGEELALSVLVIDDTETNLDIFQLFIKKQYPDASVDLAGGGYEGIGMCKIKTYDVIFLDLKMPGMNGFEVMNKLKTLHGSLPTVYAFTADVYKSTYEKVEEYGFAGILEKPLNPETLYQILKRIGHAKTA
ncbi:hybrid sensor histidine kinase/response regulator [Sulfurovum sp.]|uniref:ATP-binding response regulator n=1 Tax=Sulfurovum sp. TaxID=1969726 RepID=UPI0025F151B1|nr:hybrid sensor histidine kinase/response regulator [Sulfurovum sp.]